MSSPAYIEDKPIRKVPREKPKPAAESRMPEVKESRDTEQPELSASEGVDECTEQGENQETSSQEEDLEWQSCSCFRDSCDSCRAERLAIMDPNPSTNKPRSHTDQYMSNRSPAASLVRSVWCYDFKHICKVYHFHTSISDTTLGGRECAASPCALAALLFASSFCKNPSEVIGLDVPDLVYDQVWTAIQDAMSIYREKYGGEPRSLEPAEACGVLSDYGHFQVVMDEKISDMDDQILVHFIKQLSRNEALILRCDLPYYVVSIVLSQTGDRVLVFNSQKGPWDNVTPYKGCHLISCINKLESLEQLLYEIVYRSTGMRWHSLHFQGKFSLTKVQLK